MADVAPVQYSFQCGAFPSTQILVEHVRVEEGLSQLYTAVVDLSILDADADPTLLGGDDAVLIMAREGVERRVCGVIVKIEETRHPQSAPRVIVTIAPGLELSRHRRNTRMFQEKTVPEILETVLGEALGACGREALLELDETYEKREYCLQYQESDLHFVTRLMEEEGITYSFDHAGDVEILRLTDRNGAFQPLVTMAGDEIGHYDPRGAQLAGHEPVHRFDLVLDHATTKVVVRDFDWTKSGYVVEAEASGEDELGRTRESYEHGVGRSLEIGSYDAGARAYQKNDAERQAPLRQEAGLTHVRVGRGIGRVLGMQPGVHFVLAGHPTPGLDSDYLITRVTHVNTPPPLHGAGQEAYHNTFECIPVATPFRPRRTARKPRIDGIQTAIVTGPSGEEIHVDEHGRIKVQFFWDRENPADETSSCWVRVKQEWAGPSWGFWWVPRIGMEVVVHFVDGDPDRPLVTGSVYDAANTPPYPQPDEKTKGTIKSNSSLGGGGFNEMTFEDKAGSEKIYVHAQKDYNEVVENDHNTLVHHDQTNDVGVDQTQTIDVDQTERVDVNQTMTVGANRTVHVKGNYDETVDGTETRTVTGAVTEDFAANETRTVSGNLTETLSANETRDVTGNLTETISASHTSTVSGSQTLTVTGSLTRTGTGGISTSTPASYDSTVTASWTVTAAAGIKITAPAGVTLTIPGGVRRADNFWDVIAGEEKIAGFISTEVTISKIDLMDFRTGIWGVKLDFHASKKELVGSKMIMEAIRAKQAAAMAKRSGGLISETEAAKLIA
jgi:type VI secretion system secreted protein VgrG